MTTRKMNGDTLEVYIDGEMVLTIRETAADNEMTISVSGELRTDAAHDFEDEVMAAFSVCGKVRIDLSGVTYIAGLAMSSLLSMQQIVDENGELSMVITGARGAVRDAFEEAGFLDMLYIED